MKVRKGFISNSSSCSFVVCNGPLQIVKPVKHTKIFEIPQSIEGNKEFGREDFDYDGLGDRINFALLLAQRWDCAYEESGGIVLADYEKNDFFWKTRDPNNFRNLTDMLRKTLKKHFEADIVRCYLTDVDDEDGLKKILPILQDPADKKELDTGKIHYGYIDHGSMPWEQPGNLGIFERVDILELFLFGKGSYVANRSDETDGFEGDEELLKSNFWCKQWYDHKGF